MHLQSPRKKMNLNISLNQIKSFHFASVFNRVLEMAPQNL